MTHTQDQILLALSYLRGERSIPSNVEGRKEFIQGTLHELNTAFPWKFAEVNATLTFVSGLATLPSGVVMEHPINLVDESTLSPVTWTQVDVADRVDVRSEDPAFWITSLGSDRFLVNTKATISALSLTYQAVEPTINASITTQYPDRLTIAMGANRFVKLSEDPDADLSQDDAMFRNRMNANIAAQNVSRTRSRRKTAQTESGSYTGEF